LRNEINSIIKIQIPDEHKAKQLKSGISLLELFQGWQK